MLELRDDFVAELAAPAARFLGEPDRHVHRRVEQLAVPLPERPLYRRAISVDFTIPDFPALPGLTGPSRYLIPLSLISKCPPLLDLDLRDEAGQPLPFLTKVQTAKLDGRVLEALAEQALGEPLEGSLRNDLRGVADHHGATAFNNLYRAIPLIELATVREIDRQRLLLRNDRLFTAIASDLAPNSLLWFLVSGEVGDRRIVKFAFEQPWLPKHRNSFLASLAIEPFRVRFPLPQFGRAEGYHLSITAPEPIQIHDARLDIDSIPTPTSADRTAIVRQPARGEGTAPECLSVSVACTTTRARFYVRGDRVGCDGHVWVAVTPDTRGFLNGALGAAWAVAALLGMFAANMSEAVRVADAGVAVLLIAPLLLSYVLVRPTEHILVGGYVRGLRRLLVATGAPPVVGALFLALAGEDAGGSLVPIFRILFAMAVVPALLFSAVRLMPWASRGAPWSRGSANGRLMHARR